MIQDNPYAPPSAEVNDIEVAEAAPRLWNPGAAAAWSLIFSPVFGAYLHMKNWQALEQPEKAAIAKNWAIGAGIFLVAVSFLSVFLSDSKAIDAITRFGGSCCLSPGTTQAASTKAPTS